MNTHQMHHTNLTNTVQDCEVMCEHMISHLLMHSQDLHLRHRQLQLLRDCADICTVTAKYLARHSSYSKSIAGLCASICEACGNECARFTDKESQKCAHICLHCAMECRAFAM